MSNKREIVKILAENNSEMIAIRQSGDKTTIELLSKNISNVSDDTEILKLRALPGEENIYDVEESMSKAEYDFRSGPAMVNSNLFKTGWDNIWGQKDKVFN